jgi:hypothetical protein
LGAGNDLSPHLQSRHKVGQILANSGLHTIEFRAGIIIGSGSFSFEMIRALVDRLPVMITPRWAKNLTQPIAIEDVIEFLYAAIESPIEHSDTYEIGCPDPVSYKDLMKEYGRQRGLNRVMIQVPVLTPRLSSLWLGLVTPVYARIGRKLVEGLRNETVILDQRALETFNIRSLSYQQAIKRALQSEDNEFAKTRWSDAISSKGFNKVWGGKKFGSRLIDIKQITVNAGANKVFKIIERIGGETGWYRYNWMWRVRGWIDLLLGGVGLRRGRKNPDHLCIGDALDFWRVEIIIPNQILRLQAEMKLPGRAWLQFELNELEDKCKISPL